MSNQPEWGGERGGFDDFEYTFEEVKFGYDERYDAMRGKSTLRFLVTGTAVLDDGSVHNGSNQAWNTGKGWDPIEGGAAVAKEDGSEVKPMKNPFHYQSGYAGLVRAAIGCGAGDVLNARCGGDPTNLTKAAVWSGLKFRLQRLPQGTFKNDAGEEVEYSALLPTEFLGKVGSPSSAGGSNGTDSSASNGGGSLEDLASGMEDKMDFLTAAVKKGADITEAEKVWDKAHA